MWCLIGASAWLVCGVLAYGFQKECVRHSIIENRQWITDRPHLQGITFYYSWFDKASCWIHLLLGPIGLAAALLELCSKRKPFRLLYRMPEEFKRTT